MINEETVNDFSDAVIYGEIDTVKQMVAAYPELIRSQDKYKFTALHNVMCEEQEVVIQYLIDQGADVDAQNDEGIAPLHLACWAENAAMLVQAGANIHIKDQYGNSPLHVMAADGEERQEVITYLLSIGADSKAVNDRGETPEDIAKQRGDIDNARLLAG